MKLYKVQITAYPTAALLLDETAPAGEFAGLDESWSPPGWLADDHDREEWITRHGDTQFFWPATGRLYQSRSGATARARLIEAYGATVEVVESEPIVWLTPEVRRARRIEALENELLELRAVQGKDGWMYA